MPQDVYAVLRQLCSTRRAHSAKRRMWIDVMPFERDHLATSKALKLLDRVRRAISDQALQSAHRTSGPRMDTALHGIERHAPSPGDGRTGESRPFCPGWPHVT